MNGMTYESQAAAVGAQADAEVTALTATTAAKDAQIATLTAQVSDLQTQIANLKPPVGPDPALPGKKVFAHYFVPYPISLDNKAQPDYYQTGYLTPTGESGKHSAYGGLLRDRPIVRAPLSGDWELADMVTEISRAKAAGLDGFIVDLLSTDSTAWNAYPGSLGAGTGRNARLTKKLLNAAQGQDFKIVLMPDMTSSVGSLTPAALATYLTGLGNYSSAFRLDDGRLVVSPFKAENWSVANWKSFITAMGGESKVALVPCFLNASAYMTSFAPISYGFSIWGGRSPATNPTGPSSNITKAHSLGKIWMQPVSTQDERPNQSIYDEAQNSQNLRNTWSIAITNNAEWVQIVTWNDYSEGTQFSPSRNNNGAWAKLSQYFIKYFKTGAKPAITTDQIYLSNRIQAVSAKPTYAGQTKLMSLRSGSSPARDTVEALVILTAPAVVMINVGGTVSTFSAPAGISSFTAPLRVGQVSASITRGSTTVASVTSPATVTSTPYVQDLQYYANSN